MPGPADQTPANPLMVFSESAEAVETHLASFLDSEPLAANLRAAIRYAVMGEGKRLRPVLALTCCEAVGGSRDAALTAASALELVHNFSLVHDDLPAMDDDDLRRGRPTLHKHTSEAMAVLAGDAMLTLGFRLLSREVDEPALASRLSDELASATTAMITGQVYDTLADDDPEPPNEAIEQLRRIHRHKTAALLRAACRMGAMSGGARAAQLEAVSAYGEAIGLMFQAVDDLLDVTQSTDQMGKETQKDAARGKLTYPELLGVAGTQAEIERLRTAAHEALDGFGEAAGALRHLCDYMAARER